MKVTIYTSFLASVVMIVVFVGMAIVYYHARRLYETKLKARDDQEVKEIVAEAKEACFRLVFILMFTVFPTTSTRVFQILPPSCQKICVDSQENLRRSYLSSDYSVECFTTTYNKFAALAFIMLCYVIGFPLLTLLLLWKYHAKETEDNPGDSEGNNIQSGLSFLYENYSSECWFWEVLELVRKIVLTSVLVLIGGEGRTSLGVAAILSGLYSVLFAFYQPITDRFEHWLNLASLLATCANMNVGTLLKRPEESISSEIKTEVDEIGITVILISVNLLATGMLIGKYNKIISVIKTFPLTHHYKIILILKCILQI